MNKDDVLALAQDAQANLPFYQDFYAGLTLSTFEDIPVVTKEDFLAYQDSTGLNYFGDLPTGYQVYETAGTKFPVPINPVQLFDTLTGALGFLVPPGEEPVKEQHTIWLGGFMTKNTLQAVEARDEDTIFTDAQKQDISLLQAELDLHSDKTIILFGAAATIEWMASENMIQDNHYVLYLVKTDGLSMDGPRFDGVKKIAVFVSTETGMIGYRYSWCSEQYQAGNQYHYVTDETGDYQDSLYIEIVDYKLVVSCDSNSDHFVFPYIRYDQDNEVSESHTDACACGHEGKTFQHVGEVAHL